MDSDKIEAAILEARKVADKELTGDKLRALLNENKQDGQFNAGSAFITAVEASKAYSDKLLFETLSRLLK